MSYYPSAIPGLPPRTLAFLEQTAESYRLTLQDRQKLLNIALDFAAWSQPALEEVWEVPPVTVTGKNRKQWSLSRLEKRWNKIREEEPEYPASGTGQTIPLKTEDSSTLLRFQELADQDGTTLMGTCPVSSEKTRCCGLLTLDAVIHCGFDCSYCTIQSFYKNNTIRFHGNLAEKLARLKLDPQKTYHIGTGQSSDSLLWGNRNGLLDDLFRFARENPNVILELKTKAGKVPYLLSHPVPPNILTTWSLNTPAIIAHEERGTASLEERLSAAEAVAARGNLVGFHFHPMVHYRGWEKDYKLVWESLLDRFDPDQVALVSLGTLTFIKPVIKAIRQRGLKTRVLQMPMEEIAGKYSYPFAVKEEMFRKAYDALSPWHGKVFFYMCMEDKRLWKPVFGREYPSNAAFEDDMKGSYLKKIRRLQS
jgi:spore photoproduct lyase